MFDYQVGKQARAARRSGLIDPNPDRVVEGTPSRPHREQPNQAADRDMDDMLDAFNSRERLAPKWD